MQLTHADAVNETTYFCYCRTLEGRLQPVTIARRNGRTVPLFSPAYIDPVVEENYETSPARYENSKYYVNLNETERRTWAQVLSALPLKTIARNEGVTRQAIYARLLGKSGRGGMIAKNYWVLIWCIARGLYPRTPRRYPQSDHPDSL